MAGKFLVIEGMDGAGTTTQAKKLGTFLSSQGFGVINSAEPTDSAIGQEIKRLLSLPIEKETNLLASLALCFAADRLQHIHDIIVPGLNDNDFVILDRYCLSSLVYQGLHLPTAFVKEINKYAIKPDLTFVLDVDAKTALDRLSLRPGGKDFYESPKLLQKIRSRYLHFANEDTHSTILIDAHGDVEQVHSHLAHAIEEKLLTD